MSTLKDRLKAATKNATGNATVPEVKISSAASLNANSDSGDS